MIRYFVFIIASFFLLSPPALTDERARNGKCYVAIGYANDRSQVSEMAKNSFINSNYFELFERKDKKVYLTLGKIDEKLFKKLQAENKTYDFGCSQGKGYEKRFGLNADFQMVAGNKKFLDTEAQFLSVVASIEIEKKRIVDAEIEKQVQARVEKLEKKRKEEEAAEAERQRLAELEKQRKAKEAAEAESQRLAELEKQRKAEEAAEKEKQRLAEIEQKRKAEEAAEKEKQRLARIAVDTEKASKLGFNSIDDMNFAIAAGFKDANSYNAVANELNQAFETSGLANKEWLFLLNKLGGTYLLERFKFYKSIAKDLNVEMGAGWPNNAEYEYQIAANIPKLLLKCNSKHGYYVIAHLFDDTADFLYVSKGQSYARKEFYNVLGTEVVLYDTSYAYPNFKFNVGYSAGVRYKNWKASVNRNSGSFYVSYQNSNPTYRPDVRGSEEWWSANSSYSCTSWDDVERYQNLKSDYIKFTKAEAVRKKEKAEAEAKAKLESRKF
jgi:hypothetical protein